MSEQPREVRIHMNARVCVRLTPAGREVIVAYYRDRCPDQPTLRESIPAAGEPYHDTLWHLFLMLGPKLIGCGQHLIEDWTFTVEEGNVVIEEAAPRAANGATP